MPVYRVDLQTATSPAGQTSDDPLRDQLVAAGLGSVQHVSAGRIFFLDGPLSPDVASRVADELLVDPVVEHATVTGPGQSPPVDASAACSFEILRKPGVMDPVALSTLAELQAAGYPITAVRTGRRYEVFGDVPTRDDIRWVYGVLANDCIEEAVPGTVGVPDMPTPPQADCTRRTVTLRGLDDDALQQLSRSAHLFLSLDEMRTIRDHFEVLGREPTDLELETLAQTWSEHCVHKTLKSAVVYRGRHMPVLTAEGTLPPACGDETRHYDNLLRDTIVAATQRIIAAGHGPECLSIFVDNAGVIGFNDRYGLAFKVETHNHPSAIEPYGGAATGIGGVIRDIIGCGLGAKPIANTDVFCVAPGDWPANELPKGVLHPDRVLRGVVSGVGEYGNRMGIPTVNGAVHFDPRFLGNPLVFCGSLGLIPRDRIEKQANPGDHVVVIGGRTGRDGIHGATFSSAELTDSHADEFSHAVQIGNAITEKRFLDAILQARDAAGGCLYSAVTDCGAGGLSSAVGEMGEHTGAVIELDRVPLKYAGLRYDEIWISEAQERMVVAVPPPNLDRFLEIMAAEEVETSVIGTFGTPPDLATPTSAPTLVLNYARVVVGELDMHFLHHGVPKLTRKAEWQPGPARLPHRSAGHDPAACLTRLVDLLAQPNIASKEWIIRQYDHEVQGGSVVKPLVGPGRGPADAAVLRPVLDEPRGVALGCGLALELADVDPYWMAASGIDEALRNVTCVGGDPRQTAILDNFCWGRCDDPQQFGGLVRACQACLDFATTYAVPFVSGKDSLNNEYALETGDVDRLIDTLRRRAERDDEAALRATLPSIERRLRATGRLAIPGTLLISAVSLVPDVRKCVTPDLKAAGNTLHLVGGLPLMGFQPIDAVRVHHAVADLIADGLLAACHDVSDGGWLGALAEMAFGGRRGAVLATPLDSPLHPLDNCNAAYVIETADEDAIQTRLADAGVTTMRLGLVTDDASVTSGDASVSIVDLGRAWRGG